MRSEDIQHLIKVSDEDGDLMKMKWNTDRHGYARRALPASMGGVEYLHHAICVRVFGRKPNFGMGEVTDHINRNRLDNRRENLRITSIGKNRRNSARSGGFAMKIGEHWVADVGFCRRRYRLRGFLNHKEAKAFASDLAAALEDGIIVPPAPRRSIKTVMFPGWRDVIRRRAA